VYAGATGATGGTGVVGVGVDGVEMLNPPPLVAAYTVEPDTNTPRTVSLPSSLLAAVRLVNVGLDASATVGDHWTVTNEAVAANTQASASAVDRRQLEEVMSGRVTRPGRATPPSGGRRTARMRQNAVAAEGR